MQLWRDVRGGMVGVWMGGRKREAFWGWGRLAASVHGGGGTCLLLLPHDQLDVLQRLRHRGLALVLRRAVRRGRRQRLRGEATLHLIELGLQPPRLRGGKQRGVGRGG